MKTKKERKESARNSANTRWQEFRKSLVEDMQGLTTKEQLDFFLATCPFTKPGAYRIWREAIAELRKK